jgi:hypothetical protein
MGVTRALGENPAQAALTVDPNPFNPATRVQLVLPARPERTPWALNVYNMRGELVRTLMRGHGGTHAVSARAVWDGRDGGDRSVASGIYVLRLEGKGMGMGMEKRVTLLK